MSLINPYKLFVGSFVPNWLMCRKEISLGAKLVYARLSQYAGRDGRAFPKQETLSEQLGLSQRQTKRYVSELVKHSLINSEKQGLGKPSIYTFNHHEWMCVTRHNLGDTYDPKKVTDMSPPIKRVKEENQINIYKKDFERLYAVYPRKEKKAPAEKAFIKLSKAKKLPDTDVLIAAIKKRLELDWKDKEKQFIPLPSSWLNGERWNDELEEPQQKEESNPYEGLSEEEIDAMFEG